MYGLNIDSRLKGYLKLNLNHDFKISNQIDINLFLKKFLG